MKIKTLLCGAALVAALGCLSGCSFDISPKVYYQNGDKFTPGEVTVTEKIDTLEVDYISGDVDIVYGPVEGITVEESAAVSLAPDEQVHTWVDGSTLRVRFCASGIALRMDNLEKHLTITVPEDVKLKTMFVDCSSGNITMSGVADEMRVDVTSGDVFFAQKGDSNNVYVESTSGNITAEAENVGNFKIHSTSGNISFEGSDVDNFASDSTSGDGKYTFESVPETINIESTSGNDTLYLPEDAGFTADFNCTSGDINYDFPLSKQGDTYVNGNGESQIRVETTSGNINVLKAD